MFNRKIIRERKREKRQGGEEKEIIMLNELSFTKKLFAARNAVRMIQSR